MRSVMVVIRFEIVEFALQIQRVPERYGVEILAPHGTD